jgi:hypothetical protein
MPRRTNKFQRLLFQIEKQLAPLGADVKESVLLPERGTGEMREVDILISLDEGQHRVRIGVECQDKSRPAGKQWVEAIAKKHEELGINKTVLVSSSGFYSAARRKAESLFISVLDFTSIGKADWPKEVLNDLKVYVRDRSSTVIKVGWVFTEIGPGLELKETSNLSNATAQFPNGSRVGLLEIVQHYGNEMLKKFTAYNNGPERAVVRLHEDLRLYRCERYIGTAGFIYLWWKHSTKVFPIRFKPYKYGNRILATGTAKRRGIRWTATAILEDNGHVRVRCEAPGALKVVMQLDDHPATR